MAILILLAILCIPIAEIAVLIKAGQVIGVGWTLVLIVLSGILGAALMRRQGLKVLAETQRKLDRGELPVGEMFDGLCVLMAGTLLLIPGFLTDVVGLLLFIPPVRLLLGTLLLSAIMRSRNSHIWVNGVEVGAWSGRPPRPERRPRHRRRLHGRDGARRRGRRARKDRVSAGCAGRKPLAPARLGAAGGL